MRLSLPLLIVAAAGCASAPLPTAMHPGLHTLAAPALLGTSDGVPVSEGGFSGLDRLGDGRFIAVTDRGPNLDAEAAVGRPAKRFPVPDYAPTLVTLALADGRIEILARMPLLDPDGRAVSGRPPLAVAGAEVETALGPDGARLAADPWGLDAEGVADAGDGTVWICEEYRPSLWRVDLASGRVLERALPVPELPTDRPLPAVFLTRTPNLGFEGLAVVQSPAGPRVVAAVQGPMRLVGADPATPVARLLVFDPATGAAETRAFALDGPQRKVGDVAALPDGRLLLVEHGPVGGVWGAAVHVLDLAAGAAVDDLAVPPEAFGSAEAALAAGVPLVPKRLVVDLLAAGWPAAARKPEGLVIDGRRLVVLGDNDYGLDAPAGDGRAVATGVPTVALVFDLPEAP